MTLRSTSLGLLCATWLVSQGCGQTPLTTDAGTEDGGTQDAGSADGGSLEDGGALLGGGCISPQGRKFIARLLSYADGNCAEVVFRVTDGGQQVLFSGTVVPPQGFRLEDARYWPCVLGAIEQADGGMHPAARRLDALSGHFEFEFVSGGRPQTYRVDGGTAAFGSRVYVITGDLFGTSEFCISE